MNEMTNLKVSEIQPPLAEKKPRALPRVWARFWRLKNGDTFFLIDGKTTAKHRFVQRVHALPRGGYQSYILWPWARVKTTVFVRDARPGGKASFPFVEQQLYGTPGNRYSAGHEGTPYRGSVGLCAPSVEQTGPSA